MSDLSKDQTAYAVYTPAIQPWYSVFPYEQDGGLFDQRVNGKLALSDLNLLAPNPLCHISHALYSAGLAFELGKADCMVRQRQLLSTTIIGDSGGFQVNRGLLGPLTDALRLNILRWLEEMCDAGHNLDVPLKALDNPKLSGFTTFDQCLDETVRGLRYFSDKRQRADFRLLNVLQGRTQDEADRWYQAVRVFRLEGVAFAGVMKADFHYVCKRLLGMIDAGELGANSWMHFLGVATPEIAIILTALKRALRRAGLTNLELTFDTSTPFSDGGRYKRAAAGLRFGSKKMTIHRHQMPMTPDECSRRAPFPFDSPVGRRLLMGDLMPGTVNGEVAWDKAGWMMLTNHNVYAEVSAIIQANKVMDLGHRLAGTIPYHVREAADAVYHVFTTGQPGKYLKAHRAALEQFSKALPEGDDSER
ncbi:conserved hypothetical protein [Azospirillaceae bacterium]